MPHEVLVSDGPGVVAGLAERATISTALTNGGSETGALLVAPRPCTMCELFAMSSRRSTQLTFSLPGFQEMVLVASVPLTGESWRPLGEGEVVAVAAGRRVDGISPGPSERRQWRANDVQKNY